MLLVSESEEQYYLRLDRLQALVSDEGVAEAVGVPSAPLASFVSLLRKMMVLANTFKEVELLKDIQAAVTAVSKEKGLDAVHEGKELRFAGACL